MTSSLPKYGSADASHNGKADGESQTGSFTRPSAISFVDGGVATPNALTLNIITGGLGTGILTLPWSTAGASLVPALVTIAAVLAVNKWTIMILVECADRFQIFDLGGLLSKLPGGLGSKTQVMCNVTVWISMFMCLVGYMIAISDSFLKAFGMFGKDPDDLESITSPRTCVLMAAAILITPLCFLDQRRLAFTSSAAVFVNVYIFLLLGGLLALAFFQENPEPPLPPVCYAGIGKGTIAMISAMMQAVIIQMCVLPMYQELQDRTPETFNKVISRGFSGLFCLFTLFSTFGYLRWGNNLEDNVLINLPENGVPGMLGAVAQLGMVIVCCGVYPIMMSPMIAPVRNSQVLQKWVNQMTIGIVIASAVTALICKLNKVNLGDLNIWNGSLCAGVFVGAVPALIGFQLMERNKVAMASLAVVGSIVAIAGIWYSDNYAAEVICKLSWK